MRLRSSVFLLVAIAGANASGANLPGKVPILDAHNCYPYDGQWTDRIDRALSTGFPVAIEQDLAWYVDPHTGAGRSLVTHGKPFSGNEPTLRNHFFERVRPIVEQALREGNHGQWPLIVLHFDFKDDLPEHFRAVWKVLGEYEDWIGTAAKTSDPAAISPIDVKPLLVLTEESDAQEKVFFGEVPVGGKLRIFGSARVHTESLKGMTRAQRLDALVRLTPEALVPAPPTNYRRWWNNSWAVVERGGAPLAGDWTSEQDRRLKALVDYAHRLGYWIRFYTLDGFAPAVDRGWGPDYNFGSPEKVLQRWKAAFAAGVDLIATDQYENLRAVLR